MDEQEEVDLGQSEVSLGNGEREREHLEWSSKHIAHLSRYALVGLVASIAVTFSSAALYSATGGTLPLGWGGVIPLAATVGAVTGGLIAFWEDVRGV